MNSPQFIKNLSIKNKIIAIVLFIVLTVISVGFLFIVSWDINKLKTDIQSNLKLDAELIGDYCVVPLTFDDKMQATEALSRLKFLESIESGLLFDVKGKLFATYPATLNDTSFIKDSPILTNNLVTSKNNQFYIKEPVYLEGKLLGSLILKANSKSLFERRKKLVTTMSALFLVLISLSYFLAAKAQKFISKPILKLADLTATISKNQDFTIQLQPQRNDEVGELYKQFNNLLSQLLKSQKERDLAEEEISFLAHVLKSVNECVTITDLNDNLIFVNQSLLNNYGYTENELIGQNITILRSPNNLPEISTEIKSSTLLGGWTGELLNLRKDGSEFPISLTTTIIYDTANQPVALVGVSNDITERKKGQETLRKSEDYFRNIFEYSTVGKIIIEMDDKYKVNKAFCNILGYSMEELENINLRDLTHPDDIEKDVANIDTILKGENISMRWEKRYIHKDGHIVWTDISIVLQRDNEHRPLYFITSVQNITERKETERKLIESEKKLREAQKMAHLGFWRWDIKTGNVEWSDEVFAIFGLDAEHFTPQIDSILERSPWPEYNLRGEEIIKMATETHELGHYEQKFYKEDKSIGYYYSTFQGDFDENDDLISIVGTIIDITERKLAEIALSESEQLLRESQKIAGLGSYNWNLSTGFWESSEILDEIFGIDADYIRSFQGWTAIIHSYWQEVMSDYVLNDVIGKCQRFDKEYMIVRQNDGQQRWVHGVGELEFDSNNKPIRLIGTILDITERKLVEIALRESEEKFKKLIESTPLPICTANKDGVITFRNERFVRDFGYDETDVPTALDWWLKAYPDEEYREGLMARWQAVTRLAIDKGTDIESEVCRVTCKNGTIRNIIISGTYIKDDFLAIFVDITERIKAEDQIQIQLDELRRWYDVMLNREERVMELKQEVNELLAKSGMPLRYAEIGEDSLNELNPI